MFPVIGGLGQAKRLWVVWCIMVIELAVAYPIANTAGTPFGWPNGGLRFRVTSPVRAYSGWSDRERLAPR